MKDTEMRPKQLEAEAHTISYNRKGKPIAKSYTAMAVVQKSSK
jgi:hypothetical protein